MGVKNKGPKRVKRKQIEVKTLRKICRVARKCFQSNESLVFQCIATVLFFGLFRISELLGDKRLGIEPMKLEQVQIIKDKAVISISSYKHSKGEEVNIELLKQRDSMICPVAKLKKLIKFKGEKKGNLFSIRGSNSISKSKFSQMLKITCKKAGTPQYTSHCFRIGGANLAAKMGRSDAEIRLLGRWKSNAVNIYLRKADPLVLNSTSRTPHRTPGCETESSRPRRRCAERQR